MPRSRRGADFRPKARKRISFGLNPLIEAAAPLLQLLGRLRNTYSQPDPGDLRERAIQQIRAFEQAARDAGVPMDQLRPAHYALCASLDDVVLNTPWGSSGGWAARSLVSTFHQEVRGGERFFDLLDQLRQNPGTFLPVLELMYLCLSLGFQGQLPPVAARPGELDRLREDLYTIIMRQRQARRSGAVAALAGRAGAVPAGPRRGADLGDGRVRARGDRRAVRVVLHRPQRRLGRCVRADCSARRWRTCRRSPAPRRCVRRHRRRQPAPDPLYVFLKPEIDQGLVTVLGDHAMPIVRIRNAGMFASGSATVAPSYVPPAGADRRGAEGGERPGDGRRLYRQPADPHRAVPLQLPAVAGARRGRTRDHRARRSAIPAASPRKATRTPIRSRQTRRRKAATRTGASKSCCGGRAEPCVPCCAFSAPAGS